MIKFNKANRRYLTKIMEEAGELVTSVAKLLLWRDADAWKNFTEELIDLTAAVNAFCKANGIETFHDGGRFKEKLQKIKEQAER